MQNEQWGWWFEATGKGGWKKIEKREGGQYRGLNKIGGYDPSANCKGCLGTVF